MNMTLTALLVLADNDGHMDWDGGWWIVMALGMVLFWGLVIGGIVWLVREVGGSHRHAERPPDAVELLDRRLAEGSITPDEYEERRAILTGASHRPSGG